MDDQYDDGAAAPGPGAVACALCGARADDDVEALTRWSMATEGGRVCWTCPGCTRRNARSIEARLDAAWW